MAWFFNKGDNKVRRRMGQVARTSWQARWDQFFSGKSAPPSEVVPPPSRSRTKRPAKIAEYDEPNTRTRRGRSLPRWQRVVQVRTWKISRPFRSFHRRVPAALLILLYLGILGGLSVLLMFMVLPANPPAPPPAAATPAEPPVPSVPEKKLTFLPEASAGKTARALTLRNADEGPLAEQMADIEFRAGNYTEAEQIYRKLFPKSATKPFMGFRIYVCALQRENLAQAADLLPRLARLGNETPAPLYAKAALALKEGRPAEATEILADAKARFGDQCADYDGTLRLIGYAP